MTINATTYDAILTGWNLPNMTAHRLDYLATRARNDDELMDWLAPQRMGADPVLVALRAAYRAQGRRLHEDDRTVTSIVVPEHGARPDRTSTGAMITIDPNDVNLPDRTPVWWGHNERTVVGHVTGSRMTDRGLRAWADIDTGPLGDQILLGVGFGEIGASIGFARDHDLLFLGGNADHITIAGEARELSMLPIAGAALGEETIVHRAARPDHVRATTSMRDDMYVRQAHYVA